MIGEVSAHNDHGHTAGLLPLSLVGTSSRGTSADEGRASRVDAARVTLPVSVSSSSMPRGAQTLFSVGDNASTYSSTSSAERLCCGSSLEPRKPVQQAGMVLTVAARLDQMDIPSPRILRCLPTVKLRVAVGEAEIAALE